MKLRPLKPYTDDEDYEWIDVSTVEDHLLGRKVVIRGIKLMPPPPEPRDAMYSMYELRETTKVGDVKQSWEWIPVMVMESEE